MEILLSQYYILRIKICVFAFAHDTASPQLHPQRVEINQLLQQTPEVSTLHLTHISKSSLVEKRGIPGVCLGGLVKS